MTRYLAVAVFGALLCAPPLYASAGKELVSQTGRVLAVDKKEVTSPNECCYNSSDAPLQTRYFAYEVSVKLNCGTYVGHYESPYDYLPSELTPNRMVQVRLAKREMYFEFPGDREMKMPIVHRPAGGQPCGPSTVSR